MAGTKGRTRQTLKKGRRGRSPLSLKLSDTGFSSLADKRWLGVAVNLNNATVGLLLWSLKQPPLPLSGVLYEQGPAQLDQELQCGATVEGTS